MYASLYVTFSCLRSCLPSKSKASASSALNRTLNAHPAAHPETLSTAPHTNPFIPLQLTSWWCPGDRLASIEEQRSNGDHSLPRSRAAKWRSISQSFWGCQYEPSELEGDSETRIKDMKGIPWRWRSGTVSNFPNRISDNILKDMAGIFRPNDFPTRIS